jgi:hypothetical protein
MATRDLDEFWRRPPHPALVAACAALPALGNGFALDDVYMIVENSRVHSLRAPWRFFAQTYWPPDRGAALSRPVTVLGFAIQWAAGGGSPAVFHIVSLVLAAATAAAVAWFALSIGLGRLPAMAPAGGNACPWIPASPESADPRARGSRPMSGGPGGSSTGRPVRGHRLASPACLRGQRRDRFPWAV